MNTQNPQSNNDDPRSRPSTDIGPTDTNTQLYGETPQNVQPQSGPQTEVKDNQHLIDKIPKILWIPLLPIVLVLALWAAFDNFGNMIPKRWRASGFFGVVQIVVGAIVAALVINTFIFQSYEVVGESMLPTLENGDRLIINKLGRTWSTITRSDYVPARGDVVVFDDPSGASRQLVKRVIGIPGDTVDVKNGVITVINDENPEGFNPDESYADSLTIDTNYTLRTKVSEDSLFVAGDNRIGGASFDSRNDLGLVPAENVIGDLVLRLLPLSDSRFF